MNNTSNNVINNNENKHKLSFNGTSSNNMKNSMKSTINKSVSKSKMEDISPWLVQDDVINKKTDKSKIPLLKTVITTEL